MSVLENIIANGNRAPLYPLGAEWDGDRTNRIVCKDGFTVSVIAGDGTYCCPRPDSYYRVGGLNLGDVPGDYPGPYTAVEAGFPSVRPEPWGKWSEYCDDGDKPTDTVYAYVPVELVRELVAAHGGER
jgi:hypothetical protein